MSGGKYFSLMPPSASCPSGMTSTIIAITIGAAKATGRFITTLTSLPQKPRSTSARVLLFCVFSASQFSHQTIGVRARGTYRASATPATTTATKITTPSMTQYSALPMTSASFSATTPYASPPSSVM